MLSVFLKRAYPFYFSPPSANWPDLTLFVLENKAKEKK